MSFLFKAAATSRPLGSCATTGTAIPPKKAAIAGLIAIQPVKRFVTQTPPWQNHPANKGDSITAISSESMSKTLNVADGISPIYGEAHADVETGLALCDARDDRS